GLAEHLQVTVAGAVLVGLARHLVDARGDPAGQEGRHVQLLPHREVGADRDRDLRIKAHSPRIARGPRRVLNAGARRARPARRSILARCGVLSRGTGRGTGGRRTAGSKRCTPISAGTPITGTVTRPTRWG